MEGSLLTDSTNYLIKNSILDSNCNHLPITSRNGEQLLAEQESDNKCNHFTIRDYVSEVRKKNAEICLPFPMPDQSSVDHANALPPLQVKRFRRWDCRRCARVIIAPKTVIPNGPNMTSQSDHGSKHHDTLQIGDATKEAAKSFAGSLQRTESSILIKESTRRSKVCYLGPEDDQNRTNKPDAEACQTSEKGGTITVRAGSSSIALPSEDNTQFLSSKQAKTILIRPNEISDEEEDQVLSKIGKGKELVSLVDRKYGALPSSLDQISHHFSKNLDECSDEQFDPSIHFIYAGKPGVSVEKSHPRKAHKIRTINDIMKSAALRKVDKNCSSSENIGGGVRGSTQIPEASKDNDKHHKHRGHSIQDKEPMSIKRKKNEALSKDGEGTSLNHWLKKVPTKPRLLKGELEAKDINHAASTSKCASLKGLDLNLEYSARGEKKKEIIEEKKKNTRPEVVKLSFTPRQKGRTITEDLQAEIQLLRSPGIMVSGKDFRRKIENYNKKSLLGNKKNKRPLIEDGASSQPGCFKDSLGIQEHAFARTKEVKRKQRTMRLLEREGADDIPMDIVEHLAKKQHEKYLMNLKEGCSNLSKLPESIENVKNLNGCNNAGSRISMINNGDTESRSKSKQFHLFDLNQEAPTCASTELWSPSPYIGLSMTGGQLAIIDSNRSYFPQNLSPIGMNSPPFHSDHANQTVSPQNLLGKAHDGGSVGSLNRHPSHINAQNITSSFAYPSPESRNGCHSNVMAPGEFLRSEIENIHGGYVCKPLRPLPRFGILGPLLQKEITNTWNNIRPTLGFGSNSQLSFHNTSFIASNPNPPAFHNTMEKIMNVQTSILLSESWTKIDNNGQVPTDSRNRAFHPLKSDHNMQECVVNRNPADFTMADEDSEYMIGYTESKAKPHSGKLQSQTNVREQKGQKMRKLSEIKRSRKNNRASSRGKV